LFDVSLDGKGQNVLLSQLSSTQLMMNIMTFFCPLPFRRIVVPSVAVLLLLLAQVCVAQVISGKPKVLAPGVMKTIPASPKFSEAFNITDVVELAEFDWAKNIRFERLTPDEQNSLKHATWGLEFQFKPPRLIEYESPAKSGKMEKKVAMYLVYNVTNKKWTPESRAAVEKMQGSKDELAGQFPVLDSGSAISTKEVVSGKDETVKGKFAIIPEDIPISPVLQFILATPDNRADIAAQQGYGDQIIPLAIGPIVQREDINRTFETTVSMADRVLKPGETAWGIAMWTDFDPNIKDFSIFVSGLSNAYRWSNKESDMEGAFKKGDVPGTGREMVRKTLKLNFWAPGDARHLMEKEIRYGGNGTVDFEWVYR